MNHYNATLIRFKILAALLLVIPWSNRSVHAQSITGDTISTAKHPSLHKPLLTGNFFIQLKKEFNNEELPLGKTAYFDFGFSPIVLWKISRRIFVESELEISSDRSNVHMALGYFNASFIVNRYLTLTAGNFLSPLGIYQERLHPAWINKMPDAPPGFGHDGTVPATETGLNLRGGIPVRSMRINYCLYASQGPILQDGDHDPEAAGRLEFKRDEDQSALAFLNYKNYRDNNNNKAIGGRIGWLPLKNSSLEIGVSASVAKPGGKKEEGDLSGGGHSHANLPDYSRLNMYLYGIDLSYIHKINSLKGTLEVKGQYNRLRIEQADYLDTRYTAGETFYTFENISENYFLQLAYRPSFMENKLLRKAGFHFRQAGSKTPSGSLWEQDLKQSTFGLNYWYNWHSVFKLALQAEYGSSYRQILFLQWALQF